MLHEPETLKSPWESRVEFETFLADCAARFTAVRMPANVEQEIEDRLRQLLGFFHAERCVLLGGTPAEHLAWVTCAAYAEGVERGFGDLNFAAAFPWLFERLCGGEQAVMVSLSDLPPAADTDRRSAEAMGVRSMLAVPVHSAEGNPHCLLIQSLREESPWPPESVARLPVLAQVFVNALNRKRLEDTWRQVETRHEDLLESVSAIVWRADARTFQTTFVSREAEAILGYPIESWIKVPGFWVSHVHPDDREWVTALSAKAIQEHRMHDFDYRMVVADGRTVWLRNIVKVLVENGNPTELVGVTVDISERKRAEFEAAQLRHQLTHVGRVTSLGELAATLAHELNQPLGAIVSNAEAARLFLDRVPPSIDELRAILEDIERDGQRAGAIVHRVRLLLQRRTPDMKPLDVAALIEGFVGLARPFFLGRQIDLTAEVPPDLPAPCGDLVQIQQVLINLMLNAIDAVADQPPQERQVRVRAACRDGGGVEFSVTDSGPGIPAETLPHVFEPFFTTKREGMGMGLPICRTIVQSHGGDVRVRNNPAGGTTVVFTLPPCDGADQGAP